MSSARKIMVHDGVRLVQPSDVLFDRLAEIGYALTVEQHERDGYFGEGNPAPRWVDLDESVQNDWRQIARGIYGGVALASGAPHVHLGGD